MSALPIVEASGMSVGKGSCTGYGKGSSNIWPHYDVIKCRILNFIAGMVVDIYAKFDVIVSI